MVEMLLTVAAFLSLLAFLVMVLQHELDLSLFISGILGVSVTSVGFLLALGVQLFVGLSMLHTTFALGGVIFVTAGTYELVS